jgi:hypothetical protein
MRDNWINFFEFENSGGGGSAWPEVLQATQHSNGTYDFRIWNPPTSEDDEPSYIEWSSDEPVFAAEILEQLTEGLVDREFEKSSFSKRHCILPHQPKADGALLKNSMPSSLKWIRLFGKILTCFRSGAQIDRAANLKGATARR